MWGWARVDVGRQGILTQAYESLKPEKTKTEASTEETPDQNKSDRLIVKLIHSNLIRGKTNFTYFRTYVCRVRIHPHTVNSSATLSHFLVGVFFL